MLKTFCDYCEQEIENLMEVGHLQAPVAVSISDKKRRQDICVDCFKKIEKLKDN